MIASYQTYDFLFYNSSGGSYYTTNQEHTIQEDLIMNHDARDGSDLKNNKRKGWGRKSLATNSDDKNDVKHDDDDERKKMHREMERQRRQEMGSLHASLRSLLPLEYIKGKRAVSDHINEAVNYINHLQEKIKDLGVKREELEKLSSWSSRNIGDIGSLNNSSLINVAVSPCWGGGGGGGVEIIISSDLLKGELPLSRVLQVLLDEGLNVVSCISTKVNEGVICKIQSEVEDQTPLNLPELQRKLNEVLYCP